MVGTESTGTATTARDTMTLRTSMLAAGLVLAGGPALAQTDLEALRAADLARPVLSTYTMPGLIDMPTSEMQPDGQLTFSGFYREGSWRTGINFQISPRLTGTFRYSFLDEPLRNVDFFDRSFSVAFRFIDEGRWRPAFTVGVLDLIGTGVYAAEYVVATKNLPYNISVSAGIGWGRFGSFGGFRNPLAVIDNRFETRPGRESGDQGGTLTANNWFRGDAALFGGLNWRASDRLTLTAEYSSDAYDREVTLGGFDRKSPLNFGVNYRAAIGTDVGVYYLYGSALSVVLNFSLNPNMPVFPGGREGAPPPVLVRSNAAELTDPGFGPATRVSGTPAPDNLTNRLTAALADQGIQLIAVELFDDTVRVRIRNERYDAEAQAIGRTARVLSRLMAPGVEWFEIVPTELGLPLSVVTIARSDLEDLEFDPDRAWRSYVRADLSDAGDLDPVAVFAPGAYPDTLAGLRPYIAPALFDPDDPLRADFGVDLDLGYSPASGVILSGKYRQKIVGNRDSVTRVSDSVLPRVRSDITIYDQEGSSYLSHLTGEYFWRPGTDLYARATGGYLERMYAGASGELLWKPVDSRLALGAEINYARKRAYDGGLGLQDYDVVTGHASAYYAFGGGYEGQVDAGRYLAGDWGGTFTMSRRFASGWRVGGFFTLTDVPFSEFGEGSFDKGIFFEAPIAWLSGQPSRTNFAALIQPITRDGGARLFVRNRLNEVTNDYHEDALRERWPRYWR